MNVSVPVRENLFCEMAEQRTEKQDTNERVPLDASELESSQTVSRPLPLTLYELLKLFSKRVVKVKGNGRNLDEQCTSII